MASAEVRRASILALVTAAVDAAIPLLPLYGNGHQTVFSLMPGRFVLQWLVGAWGSVVIVLLGVWLLRQGHAKIAAGVFAAMALGLVFELATNLIGGGVFSNWRGVLVLCLEVAEAVLLLVAVRTLLGEPHATPS